MTTGTDGVHPNVTFVVEAHARLEEGDLAAINDMFAVDITWHEFGSSPLAGREPPCPRARWTSCGSSTARSPNSGATTPTSIKPTRSSPRNPDVEFASRQALAHAEPDHPGRPRPAAGPSRSASTDRDA
jgi:hypothetical protein